MTIAGDIGNVNNAPSAIILASDNNLTIDATNTSRNIYSPIQTLTTNTGNISTNFGNNVADRILFTQSIGSPTNSLAAINIDGNSANVVAVESDIYAHNINHTSTWLDTSSTPNAGIVIHGNYIATNAVINTGDTTLSVAPGNTATLVGTLNVNASYAVNGQIVLDLSQANVNSSGLTALYVNITNSVAPISNNTIFMVKGLTHNIPTILGTGTDPLWSASTTPGMLIYNVRAPSYTSNTSSNSVISEFPSAGATSANITHATAIIGPAASQVSNGVVTFRTSVSGALQILDDSIYSTTAISYILTSSNRTIEVDSDIVAYTSQFNSLDVQTGWLNIFGQTIMQKPGLTLNSATNVAYAVIASEASLIPYSMANAIMHPEITGTSKELVDEMVKVSAVGGMSAAEEMIQRITSSTDIASLDNLNTISSRQSFLYTPALITFEAPPVVRPNASAIPEAAAVPVNLENTSSNTPSPTSNNPERLMGEDEFESPRTDLEAEAYGIAAGSTAYDKYGVWMHLNFNKAAQKAYKGSSGFKSYSTGFAIGADTMLNDNTSIGITVSNTLGHIKYKDTSIGNKADSSSWVGALYGNRQLKNDWFLRGAILLNRTRMNSKELRIVQSGYGVAQAKYNLISYGGEVSLGFAHRFKNDLILTPNVGIRGLHNNKSSYGQFGNTKQNNKISTNAVNNYYMIGGLSLSKTFIKNDIAIIPEIHANLQYDINQNAPSGAFVSALTPNQNINFIGNKAPKVISFYGTSLTGIMDRLELGITGDMSIANKYIGYQGSLKLKIMF